MTNEQTKELVEEILIQTDEEYELYKKRVGKLTDILRKIQNSCLHEETHYVPDASGNNDSYMYCEFCRLERKRF
jgi:hypothetical protein